VTWEMAHAPGTDAERSEVTELSRTVERVRHLEVRLIRCFSGVA
jgi:hypothetical protein